MYKQIINIQDTPDSEIVETTRKEIQKETEQQRNKLKERVKEITRANKITRAPTPRISKILSLGSRLFGGSRKK